jgi:glycosyltransferase involved in cell wall biosynthesis
VVMSVFNGAGHLPETLDSVLLQQACDFEFIIIDDGSTDGSGALLDSYAARDARVRVLHQENTGLTLALARGCAEARGEFIARQDAGDLSLLGRLALQLDFLQQHPEAVMAACGVNYTGPAREPLHTVVSPMLDLDQGLRHTSVERLRGPPHHGGAMFRRAAYEIAGGYRLPFVVAQDIDLWLRLCEQGLCLGMSEALYEARLDAGSISSRRRNEQFRLGRLALACAAARREGSVESPLLQSHQPAPGSKRPPGRIERARFHYFIASCLRVHDPLAAKRYYRKTLSDNPFHLKALLRSLIG